LLVLGITHLDHPQLPGFAELDMQELQEADSLGDNTGPIPVFEHGAYGKIWDDIRKYMENRWAWKNLADLRKINRWKYVDMMDFTGNHVVDFSSKHRFYLGMYQHVPTNMGYLVVI